MSLELAKGLRRSMALTALLAGVLSISACQQQSETEGDIEDGINTEETVPMSAEPAEPTEVIIDTTDTSVDEVEGDAAISIDSAAEGSDVEDSNVDDDTP